ncbi:Zn-dependent protease [Flavobacterium foetidum]|uniref:Zn-dependent protease n=1 Tax=Flavobacterium foetidum TaxID=2026681 RepID=UPI001074E8A2|nr:Zn-dependent protease [Flavobacterium foetidum]KAF2516555.1 Zn-dependent protease [Flavobacterium foetidum]
MHKIYLLLIVLFLCSCQKNNQDNYFDTIEDNDFNLMPPAPGEWLYGRKEKGQDFETFLKTKHIVPNENSNIIYIKPIGDFTELQTRQIELTRAYLEIFFQLETKVLENTSNDVIPKHARRIGQEGQEQFLAGYILDSLLKKEKPRNRIALMALTEKDLFPKPEWNFVFGLASYTQKIGVSSIYRLQDRKLTEANFNLCLSRLLKICSHEIGHMFGLRHCVKVNCAMNGTNSLEETDTKVIRLCSVCQQKLNSSIKYDNKKRLVELGEFFKNNNLKTEFELMKKDLESIE